MVTVAQPPIVLAEGKAHDANVTPNTIEKPARKVFIEKHYVKKVIHFTGAVMVPPEPPKPPEEGGEPEPPEIKAPLDALIELEPSEGNAFFVKDVLIVANEPFEAYGVAMDGKLVPLGRVATPLGGGIPIAPPGGVMAKGPGMPPSFPGFILNSLEPYLGLARKYYGIVFGAIASVLTGTSGSEPGFEGFDSPELNSLGVVLPPLATKSSVFALATTEELGPFRKILVKTYPLRAPVGRPSHTPARAVSIAFDVAEVLVPGDAFVDVSEQDDEGLPPAFGMFGGPVRFIPSDQLLTKTSQLEVR